jgi:hypothetical protein
VVNTMTKAELKPSFFTFVVSAAATSPSTRVLGLVAAALTTHVIAPATLPVPVALVPCNFLVLLLLDNL